MADRNRTYEKDPLADPLEREARPTRPEFSEALHVRFCAAVRTTARVELRRDLRRLLLNWSVAAAAAIAVLAGSVFLWNGVGHRASDAAVARSQDPQLSAAPAEDLDEAGALVEQATSGLGTLVETTVSDQRWAGLDRDARAAFDAVTAPLPFEISLSLATAETAK
jgi:hypothetical protein